MVVGGGGWWVVGGGGVEGGGGGGGGGLGEAHRASPARARAHPAPAALGARGARSGRRQFRFLLLVQMPRAPDSKKKKKLTGEDEAIKKWGYEGRGGRRENKCGCASWRQRGLGPGLGAEGHEQVGLVAALDVDDATLRPVRTCGHSPKVLH